MTILPELRDGLARSRPILPELRDGLVAARPRRRRRPALIAGLTAGTLLATAGALAATGVIGIGAPVEPKHVNRDPERGVGVPVDRSARLLPLRVADPDGGPPWGLRLVTTSRGMLCLQIGRMVGDQLGVLGDDGRLHPLPAAAAASRSGPCVPPDGASRYFTAVDRLSSASGVLRDPVCHEPAEPPRGRPACPPTETRQVAYGLLGPQAQRITFADGTWQEPAAPEGAYLFVRARGARDGSIAMGGGPSVGMPDSAVARVDYRDGTSCPSAGEPFCPPKGYVEPRGTPRGSVRRPLQVSLGRQRFGSTTTPVVRVSFRAPVAITAAKDVYVLEGRFPDSPLKSCRHVVFYAPTTRNVERGRRIRLTGVIPRRCQGRLVGTVVLGDIRYSNGKPPAATVGRFTRTIR